MVPSDRTRQHQRNILKSLRQGDLLRIKGNQPFKSPDVYHVFVVLNINPAKDELLLVVNGTTKYYKRMDYYRRRNVPPTKQPLLFIRAGKYPFFSRDTCIDCQSISRFNPHKLDDCDIKLIKGRLDETDFNFIISVIATSRQVSSHYKRLIGIHQAIR